MNSLLTGAEANYFMCTLTFIMYCGLAKIKGVDPLEVPKTSRFTLILRGMSGCLGNITFLMAVQLIELSRAAVLNWTSPMYAAILAKFFLGENISKYDWVSIIFTFVGILVI
jgi:drug/metabolite transporter (DMT)-like permease